MPEIVPCKGPLGARIEGLDRRSAGEPEVAALLNRALAEHLLVVVPGGRMAPAETLAFAHAFGTPRRQLLRYKHSGEVPEVSIMVSTLMADGTTDKTAIRAEDWHTDDSYFAVPAKATLLHAIEIPSRGGATWFCNMHSVYESLPEKLRRRIDGMRAIHGYDTPRARNRPSPRTPQEIAETPDVEHPLVRTHPETGRKALYLSNHTQTLDGFKPAEARPILDFLARHAVEPEFTCRFRWEVGSIAIWDNRCTQHRALNDYAGKRRRMHRITIAGDTPY
jgi:taurine dioxygenase